LKTLRLAAILIAVYILVPALILGSTFSRPDVLTVETIIQFLMGIILFSLLPHAPACLVLFLMMVSKGIHTLPELRQHKAVMLSAIFVLVAHLGTALLMGGKPVEFGMLVNFFFVPLLGAVAIVCGIIIGRVLAR
jgi:hypothetical protein